MLLNIFSRKSVCFDQVRVIRHREEDDYGSDDDGEVVDPGDISLSAVPLLQLPSWPCLLYTSDAADE